MSVYRTQAAARCPRCGDALLDLGPYRRCGCGGMWIRDEVLGAALGRKGKPVPAHWHWWRRPELACPECGHAMRSLRTPSLVFDRCPAHGLWFDAGELATFLRLAGATGGPALDDEAVLAVVTKHLGAARRRASQPRARRKRKPAE